MLVSKTSAAAFPLSRFHGLAGVPEKRARVPEVAYPCHRTLHRIPNVKRYQKDAKLSRKQKSTLFNN